MLRYAQEEVTFLLHTWSKIYYSLKSYCFP